jgi:hypothetical protein
MNQVEALLGEEIFEPGRVILVRETLEDLAVDEAIESLGQGISGDSKARLKVVELGDAQESIADDEKAPPFADNVEGASDGAMHPLEA